MQGLVQKNGKRRNNATRGEGTSSIDLSTCIKSLGSDPPNIRGNAQEHKGQSIQSKVRAKRNVLGNRRRRRIKRRPPQPPNENGIFDREGALLKKRGMRRKKTRKSTVDRDGQSQEFSNGLCRQAPGGQYSTGGVKNEHQNMRFRGLSGPVESELNCWRLVGVEPEKKFARGRIE